jgi:uncharacterized protein with HEPN domain
MPPTLADRVRHILAAITDVELLLAGKTQTDYETDRYLQLATERALEIVCEASRHIPADVKAREPEIAWPRMVDFGNRLRHAYHRIDVAVVLTVVKNEIPVLKAFVERVIREEEGR